MRIVAIDPGTRESGYILGYFDRNLVKVLECGTVTNLVLADALSGFERMNGPSVMTPDILAIEMIHSFGKKVGRDVFDTLIWIGRFLQATEIVPENRKRLINRSKVKARIAGKASAGDKDVRAAIIERYGGEKERKRGGALHGVTSHAWQALGVGLVVLDEMSEAAAAVYYGPEKGRVGAREGWRSR